MREHIARVLRAYQPTKGEQRLHDSCLAWVAPPSAAPAPASAPKADLAQLQATLLEHCSKAFPMTSADSGWWARTSALATKKGATAEGVARIARWVDTQSWLSQVTLVDLLRKWEEWLAKASSEPSRATAPASEGNIPRRAAW